ncbi:MAG TPA: DNA polymerase I [Vicinamibacterales bacterium]|nr:DNA polymerase I [Vicinamibacterales bacterium]
MARLFLIDGSNQMYRAYHAIRELTGPDGKSTNAVYGFTTMLKKLLADHQPEFIAASFDLAGPTFRSDIAADYKANRSPMPPDLAEQIPWVHEACEAMGVPILTSERYEADDVIGTLARKAADAGYDVAIVTGDKDFFQLVGGPIKVFNPRDEGTWFDAEAVEQKLGVKPELVVDVMGLMGDTIDNIKGVPGIGEKGAPKLIAEYGSLDALLARAPEITKPKLRESLITHADSARQSRELARIHTDVPVAFEPGAMRYRGPSPERAYALFSKLGFRTLVNEYAPTADTVARDYALVTTGEALDALAGELSASSAFAFRVLTDGGPAMRAAIAGLAFSTEPRRARYVPFAPGTLGGATDLSVGTAIAALKPVFENASIGKVGHDLKFDAIVLARHGVTLALPASPGSPASSFDTMIASYLVDATRSSHLVEDLALEQIGYKARREEDVCGRGARALRLSDVSPDAIVDFAGERSDLPLQLAAPLRDALARESLDRLYADLEMPLVPVLVAIERAGVKIDASALAGQSRSLDAELAQLSGRIFALAGLAFNINSPRQLSEVLFEKLGLKPPPAARRTMKTKATSTAADVLEDLAEEHEVVRLILQWRVIQKLKGTYIDALPQLIHPLTGRVHTCFNQAVAATGRLSSSDPNLQNIPIRTPAGREIRRAFVAEDGHVLLSADYSQIELRVLAHLAQDAALIDAFRAGEDIHDRTAAALLGGMDQSNRQDLRATAKMVNYAVLYGKTKYTLAKDIDVSQDEAQAFIDAYFAGFPGVRAYIDRTLDEARRAGIVRTPDGRRRLVPDLNSTNGQIRARAERETTNFPIQGMAADILKRAMVDTHAALVTWNAGRPTPARMILTVHDELLFEVPEAAAEEVTALVRGQMERAAVLDVPLTVDVGAGANWKDAKS